VKNVKKEEVPRLNIERNPLFLLLAVTISATILFWGYLLLKDVNPLGFIVLIPGSIISFQSLWWLLNPFALIFDDKVEIKQSLLHHKYRYFVDVKKINGSKKSKIYITYNDDEMEALNLFGIKSSHVDLLKSEMEKSVSESIKTRP
jgi:hypothetical protein